MPKLKSIHFQSGIVLAALISAGASKAEEAWPIAEDLGFKFYGQINQAYTNYDDGQTSRGFFTVDNSTNEDNSFVGIRGGKVTDNGSILAGRFELRMTDRRSDTTSIQNPAGGGFSIDKQDIMRAEIGYATDGYGTIFFGQGDMSGNLWSPDYSGTTVISRQNLGEIAGGMRLLYPDGTVSDRTINESVGSYDSGRRFRLRYDTPNMAGFTASASVGREVLISNDNETYVDLVGKYESENRYSKYGMSVSIIGEGDDVYAGSVAISYLHKPTGLNFTYAGGNSTDHRHYYMLKAGIIQNLFSFGSTALAFEWYNNGNWAAEGAEDEIFGVSLVQRVDSQNLEIYAAMRSYDDYNNLGIANEDFQKSNVTAIGVRWMF